MLRESEVLPLALPCFGGEAGTGHLYVLTDKEEDEGEEEGGHAGSERLCVRVK